MNRAVRIPTKAASGTAVEATAADGDEPLAGTGGGSFLWLTALPGWLLSAVIHAIMVLALALYTFSLPDEESPRNLMVLSDSMEIAEDLSQLDLGEVEAPEIEPAESSPAANALASELPAVAPVVATEQLASTTLDLPVDPLGMDTLVSGDVTQLGGGAAGALSGRNTAAKKQLLRQAGGTAGSEAAVARALQWFAEHQFPDGSWNLDHRGCPNCRNRCRNPGDKPRAPFGATGLALLPFLGAGHTHQEGDYHAVVERGITFLLNHARLQEGRASLTDPDGSYYSHGLCTIAVCEAFAMTKDKRLAEPAQMLVNEIVYAQDPRGGGWRYSPHEPGDTSVLGWQLMALKSAHMAGLIVPPATVQRAAYFLDSVESAEGFKYRYLLVPDSENPEERTDPTKFVYRRSTSSVGLLCRMYLGWERQHPKLIAGVEWLGEQGPAVRDEKNLYLDYYATQVMRHYGGEPWEKWNDQIRDFLVERQTTQGHESGSWFMEGSHNDAGGRMYCTSLATMILEVYYRHLPLYKDAAAEDDFPL